MNIFILDTDPALCAAYHCDKHVVKMCIEYAQLLSTAARVIGYVHDGYASTHEKHPCTIWAADHVDNWSWLYRLAVALGDEYTHRYGKTHKSTDALRRLPYDLRYYAINRCSAPDYFIGVVPEKHSHEDDVVGMYRAYYCDDKARFAKWKKREAPGWFIPICDR